MREPSYQDGLALQVEDDEDRRYQEEDPAVPEPLHLSKELLDTSGPSGSVGTSGAVKEPKVEVGVLKPDCVIKLLAGKANDLELFNRA